MSEARELTDLAAQLEAVVAENRAMGERLVAVSTALRAMQAEHDAAEADAIDFPDHDLIEVAVAAIRFRTPPDTIRLWCRTKDIGTKRGGRWMVSCTRLRTLLRY